MSAGGDRGRRRRELEAAAEELFDAIHSEDLDALVEKFGSRPKLCSSAVDLAEKVLDHLGRRAEQVAAADYGRLVAATLTWGREHLGVARRIDHALTKFRTYLRYPQLPPEILVRISRVETRDDRVIDLLAHSVRILEGVTAARPVGEGVLILTAVVPAVVEAIAAGPAWPPDAAADVALVATTLGVLERAAGLAARYRVSLRPTPGAGGGLPIVGNVDFLVRMAAYRLAIEERRGRVAPEPLDDLQEALPELEGILRAAMTRSAGRPDRRTPDEPDVAAAFDQFAAYLGAAGKGGRAAGRRVRDVYALLNHRLHLPERPREGRIEDPPALPSPPRVDPSDVEHLVGWLVAALFQGAGPHARLPLMGWLLGDRPPDRAQDLPLLVRRLRVATDVLDGGVPDSPPPRPAGVPAGRLRAMTARLAAAVDPAGVEGCTQADVRRVTLAALPPLWTRRRPVIALVARHLEVLIGPGHSGPRKALLVAAAGVRAPVQLVHASTSESPVPCCPDSGGAGRFVPGRRGPREPVPADRTCPHRPWGEIGWVENYTSLGNTAGFAPEAARRQLERYRGPWPELLR